jgi:hypothetical protein
VDDGGAGGTIPELFRVESWPNPFNGTTTIRVELPGAAEVRIDLFTVAGEFLRTIAAEDLPAGAATFVWTPAGETSGVYICRVTSGGRTIQRKLVYIK